MASFEFSLNNGMALMMPAGGATACGMNFSAGINDAVFQLTGEYSMTIDDSGDAIITLYNMHGLIFPNKANFSHWLYYDTIWARNHDNCLHISLDVGTSRQPHGGWSDENTAWHQRVTGWKGGTGIRGYDQWIKYRYDIVEPACAGEYVSSGCCDSGSYIGSAKAPDAQVFNIGHVDFGTMSGFWIGANLDCYEGGWEQWQFVPFPIVLFSPPFVSIEQTYVDVCEELVLVDVSAICTDDRAASGGTWELQYSTSPGFDVANTFSQWSNNNRVTFTGISLASETTYYFRARLVVNDTLMSRWGEAQFSTHGSLPRADAMARDIDEQECYNLQHGIYVEGGLL